MRDSLIERIQREVDIVDYVEQFVDLRQQGRTRKGQCPFHNDRDRSLVVDRDTGRWSCHGCDLSGDVIEFSRRMHGTSSAAAVKLLCAEFEPEGTTEEGCGNSVPFGETVEDSIASLIPEAARSSVPVIRIHDYAIYNRIDWLFRPWFPKGYLTLIVGEPGVGKTYLAAYVIACCAGGQHWPDGSVQEEPVKVLLVETEQFRVPYLNRLEAMGVPRDAEVVLPYAPDAEEPHWFTARLPRDMDLLEQHLATGGEWVVVVDSLPGVHRLDENSADVRSVLNSLVTLAGKYGRPVIATAHLRKRGRSDNLSKPASLDRIRGSSIMAYTARSIIGLRRDPATGAIVVEQIKNNLCEMAKPFGFGISADRDFQLSEAPTPAQSATKTQECVNWLLRKLANENGMPSAKAIREAAKAGFSQSTLYRARELAKVISHRGCWFLPSNDRESPSPT